jgi:CSLREA domain-containing protein
MISRRKAILLIAGVLILVVILAVNGVAASPPQQDPEFVFVVTTTEDHNDGFCNVDCSLREAIIAANQWASHATIVLPSGTYTLTLEGSGEDDGLTGDLDITSALTIVGDGPETTIIDAGGMSGDPDRVLDMDPAGAGGYEVDLWGVTITGGHATGAYGGGIHNVAADVRLQRCAISGNSATLGGGIESEYGTLTLDHTTISGNSAGGGGGIWIQGSVCTLNVENSSISGNSADNSGGGIFNESSHAYLYNSTVSENSAGGLGGGLFFHDDTVLKNTILANNAPGHDGWGPGITSHGHNLDSDGTCNLDPAKGDLPSTDPKLGPLQDNGGPTLTHALLLHSPAIDAGDNSGCGATDQRGYHRPMDGDGDGTATCDIGAVEHLGLRARFPLALSSSGPSP